MMRHEAEITRRRFIAVSAAAGLEMVPRPSGAASLGPIRIPDITIKSITYCRHETQHPRQIGRNSLKDHPRSHMVPLVRVQTDTGIKGVGDDLDKRAIGKKLSDLLVVKDGFVDLNPGATFITPGQQCVLLDILGKALRRPAYTLLGEVKRTSVEVYDGTIYMRDLEGGLEELERNIRDGMAAGHRAFKLKIGRGRWTTRSTGLEKDMTAIRLARRVAGPAARLLIDANNYYKATEAVQLFEKVGDQKIFLAEELFSETDVESYRKILDFIRARRYNTLLADGEGTHGRGELMSRIEEGTVKVAQPDIRDIGLLQYRGYAAEIGRFRATIAPHTWAKYVGVAESIYLGAVTENFLIAEDCRLRSELVAITGYEIRDGKAILKETAGMGLAIDEDLWTRRYAKQSRTVS